MSATFQRLRAELGSDLDAFGARLDELGQLDLSAASPATLAQAAVALHHAYGAIEAALERTARTLEGDLPIGADWHQALLHSMTLEIETVRPAILTAESAAALRKLLAFRHFFRHAYAAPLEAAQLAALCQTTLAARAAIQQDFAKLDAFLKALADSLT